MANEYLQRQPTSSGNSRRWTISFWMKNSDPTQGYTAIMGAGKVSPTNVYNEIFYNGSQTGLNLDNSSASDNYNITANPLLRDPSAWMHVVVSFTDQGDNANTRIKFYINGAFVDHNTGTALDVSETSFFNHIDYIHYIGSRAQQSVGTVTFDAQYFDVFLVDGQALTADVFGFYKEGKGYQSSGSSDSTDFGPGQWSPHSPRKIKTEIERKGGFGVNGFYLPMNDSSNPGADFHCAPNSIIKLKGEDLPQPRNGAPTTSDAYVSQVRKEIGELGFAGCIKVDNYGGLVVPDHSDLDLGTSDFTVEGFYYIDDSNGSTGYHALFDFRGISGANGQYLAFFRHPNGHIYLYVDSAVRIDNVGFPTNKWTHVALSRSSGTTRLFVDGVEKGSFSDSFNYVSRELKIGHSATQSNSMRGFISNFRVVKGTAVYTSNFTRPTKPLENINNTIVLMAQSATSATAGVAPASIATYTYNSNSVVFATTSELTGSLVCAVPGIAGGLSNGYGDYSASIKGTGSNKTVVASGNVDIASFHSYYGSGMRFSGSGVSTADGGLVQLASVEDFTLSTGDFTLEGWLYAHVNGQDSGVFGVGSGGTEPFLSWTNGILKFRHSGSTALTFNQTMAHNQWHHVALQRKSGKISLIVNGVVTATGTDNHAFSQGAFLIGSWTSSRAYGFNGEVQDVRLYKGIAKYDGGFDVVKPYTPVGIEDFRTTADTCKNNFATLNALYLYGSANTSYSSNITLSNGNLTAAWTSGTGSNQHARSNFAMLSGKWYFEVRKNATSGSDIGVAFENHINDSVGYGNDNLGFSYRSDGNKQNSTSYSSYSGAYFSGDVLGCAYDADAGSISFYRNGSSLGTAFSGISIDQPAYFAVGKANSGATLNASVNFGQNPTFGNIAALNKNRRNSGTGNDIWHQSSNSGTHVDWTVSAGGTQLDVTVPSGNYARVYLLASDGTIDRTKKYLLSFKYTTGPANLGVNNDQGYMTAVDGSAAPNGLSSGNFYSFIIHGDSQVFITAFQGSTYRLDNVIVSEIDECYTDDSGKGKFHYQPPTGYLALCEDNLPTPTIADPGKHFKCVTYTGDSGTHRSISGVGFQPDLVWVKCRSHSKWHALVDSVRGNNKMLSSNSANAESTEIQIPSFDDNGFTVADIDSGTANENDFDYVAWCWKAGGQAVSNSDGSITSQVSVNRDAGFSIVSYTGNNTAGATIGHGLGKKPSFMIVKERTGASGWFVYHKDLGATKYLSLHDVTAAGTETGNTACWYATEPNTSVFTVGQNGATNESNRPIIAYCWTEIEGYSKFGSYLANGTADGNFVYCGFKPAWLMIKPYGSGNGCYSGGYASWSIYDSSRSPVNNTTMHERVLFANRAYEEGKRGNGASSGVFQNLDLLSNGFKIRGNSNCETNTTSISGFIFVAFAESPFQTANAK